MPRGPYRGNYDLSNVQLAVEAVQNGMSFRAAAERYKVPKTTICDRVKGKVKIDVKRSGPGSVLTPAEEELLAKHILSCGRIGYPLNKKNVKLLVKTIVIEDGRPNPFTDSLPGRNEMMLSMYLYLILIKKVWLRMAQYDYNITSSFSFVSKL